MDSDQILEALAKDLQVDIQSVLDRFLDNTDMYFMFLKKIPKSIDYSLMSEAFTNKDYKTAFERAHTLKGVTGNLGLTSLFNGFCDIVDAYRADDVPKMILSFKKVKTTYDSTNAVLNNLLS